LRTDLGRANWSQKLSATPALTLKFCSVFFLARYYVNNVRLEQFLFISVIKKNKFLKMLLAPEVADFGNHFFERWCLAFLLVCPLGPQPILKFVFSTFWRHRRQLCP
jgi:hypothetical protein